jgi:hypothetical protein
MISFSKQEQLSSLLNKDEYGWTISYDKIAKPAIANKLTLNAEDKNTPKEHTICICKKKEEEKQEEVEESNKDIKST